MLWCIFSFKDGELLRLGPNKPLAQGTTLG